MSYDIAVYIQKGRHVVAFDPVFLPTLQGRGYSGVQRYAKVKQSLDTSTLKLNCSIETQGVDLQQQELLLFPVHRPQHWVLLVCKHS